MDTLSLTIKNFVRQCGIKNINLDYALLRRIQYR